MKKLFISLALLTVMSRVPPAFASCAAPANPIEQENCLTGNPPAQWDTSDNESPTIEGYPTDISVNRGSTVHFKINASSAAAYTIDIYRLGYYAGNGARKIASVTPSAILPQTQPNCINDLVTGLIDCGNWAESASWPVPATAVSGLYIAKLTRPDTGAANFIAFVVRNDASTSKITFKTSDTTWQAYNSWGGNSLYVGSPAGRAYKVSYNRPMIASDNRYLIYSWELPALRFLEANGYDVSYMASMDADRAGSLITNHRAFISAGHDEYWSGQERANVEAARSAGVHMLFWSGNEIFWKTRWENSIDGTNTPYRTQVCYKDSYNSTPNDPAFPVWTGSWRDKRFSPPGDGGRPENALSGTSFTTEERDDTMKVSSQFSKLRFWRNTAVANLAAGTSMSFTEALGYEYDTDPDNGSRPAGMIDLSSTTTSVPNVLIDQAGTYAPGYSTHNLTLYRYPSGALVFGAGSIQWSWTLDNYHDNLTTQPNVSIKQAMINLFADMGIQPATIQSGLVTASASADATPPASSITFPTPGAIIPQAATTTITVNATDTGGVVAGVEVSVDDGNSWHPAVFSSTTWTYSWFATAGGPAIIKSRATDDSLNTEAPSAGVTVNVGSGDNPVPVVSSLSPNVIAQGGPGFTLTVNGSNFNVVSAVQWNGSNRTTTYIGPTQLTAAITGVDISHAANANITVFNPTPGGGTSNAAPLAVSTMTGLGTFSLFASSVPTDGYKDPLSVEVGVRFRGDYNGSITAIRFYKGPSNNGTHLGHLWTNTGALLGEAQFPSETASGWQTGFFPSPIPISASTTYVATYFSTTGYSVDRSYFVNAANNPPLHGMQDGADGPNGVYVYSSSPSFPNQSTGSSSYWVDVAYYVPASTAPVPNPAPVVFAMSPSSAAAVPSGKEGTGNITLNISGTNFVSNSTVQWNGSSRVTTYISSTALSAAIPGADLVSTGTYNVTVFNPAPGGGVSSATVFSVGTPYPAPTLQSISPSTSTAGGSGITLTLHGTNFISTSTVQWNGQARVTTFVSSSTLKAAITAVDLLNPTTASIAVFNPAPGGGLSSTQTFTVSAATPTLVTITPSSATVGSSSVTLTLNGTNFMSSSTIQWNSIAYAPTSVSSTTLKTVIQAADLVTLGTSTVKVINPGGATSAVKNFILFAPVPVLASISPSSTTVGSSTLTMTLNGSNFISSSTVRWNGSARATLFVSSSVLTATIPSSDLLSSATANVTVFNPAPAGGTSAAKPFTFSTVNPVPVLTSVTPSSATVGSSSFTLTLAGGSFVSASSVSWNGSPRATTFISSTTLKAAILASDLVSAGTATITVFTPAPGGGTSATKIFTITVAPNPTPTLASIAPSSATAGGSGFTLAVNGSNFISSSTVQWNGTVRATTFISSTALTAAITAGDVVTAGSATVTVFTPAPGGGTSIGQAFTIGVTPNPAPILTSITPSSATAGDSGFTLTLNGSNFVSTSTVRWNGSTRPTTFVSSATLTAAISAGDLVSSGTASVTVFTSTPGGGTSAAQSFTIAVAPNPAPVLNGIAPNNATVGDSSFTLTLNGSSFIAGSVVQWGGAARTTTHISSGALTAAIPASDLTSSGTVNVTVFNPAPGGGTSLSKTFVVSLSTPVLNPAPTLTSITPSSATAGNSGFTLAVNGNNFISSSTVQWNGTVRVTTFISSTSLTAAITTADVVAVGSATVTVFTPAPGGGTSTGQAFTILVAPNPAPVLNGITPNHATVGDSSFTLTLNGSQFIAGSIVQWNGAARSTTFISSAALSAAIPASDLTSSGTVNVSVFNPAPGGGTSLSQTFVISLSTPVLNPAPTLTSIAPSSATAGDSAFTLTVNGSNFISSSTIQWNGTPRVTSFVSSATLTAAISAGDIASSGTATVTVFNPAPGGGTSTGQTFTISVAPNPAPVLISITPNNATVGDSSFTLTLNGSQFITGSTVRWNGASRSTTYLSSAALSAAIPSSDLTSSGTVNVTVFNPAPGGGTSLSQTFLISLSTPILNPAPTVTSLAPNTATAGGSSFALLVNGSNFINGSTVLWNGATRTTSFISSASLSAVILASDIASSGTASVTVFTPAPGGGTSSGLTFTVTASTGGVTSSTTTIFGNAVPGDGYKDPSPLEVGVKFRSDVSGFITALRFYKGSFNTGTHTGHLWTGTGTLLATVTYTGESASGWQQATLSSPVAINANTTYVASYFTTTGYSVNASFFTTATNSPPLHGLQNGTDGGNGLYLYSAASAFPTSSTNSSNYWIDVVFATSGSPSNPAPILTSISPSSTTAGGSSFTLTLTGSSFLSASAVQWNGSPRPTTFVNATTLTATIPSSDIVSSSTVNVTVVNPTPGGGTSAAKVFTISAPFVPNPVPVLTTISPSSSTTGGSAFTLTVTGSNFVSGSSVRWNGAALTTTFVNGTSLTASVPAANIASTGISTVTVFSPAPGGGTSAGQSFTTNPGPNPVPVLTSISPSSATVGGSSFTLTLNGSGFIATSSVLWNGFSRATTVVNGTKLTAVILSGDIASTGTVPVSVFNGAPGGGTSASASFTINAPPPPNPAPVLSTISPSSATAGGSAFTLTVTGSNFINTSAVLWNGAARTTNFVNSITLTAAISAADIVSAATNTVTVFTPAPGGGTSSGQSFVVSPAASNPGPWTIWGSSAPPVGDGYKDPSAIEVGVRFRSDVNGYITGVRFYKWSTNTAAHTAHLWTNTGTLLATAAFTGETATGWQTVYFSTPVAVTANTTYVASYFSTTGYAVSVNTLATAVNNVPLHALASGVDGLNGIYIYSAASAFPTSSTKTSNYWVDVVLNSTPAHQAASLGTQLPDTIGSNATLGEVTNVRVFPNPWRSNVHRGVKIRFDLMPLGSEVKIFTVSAHWIKTLDASSGFADWDRTNDSGQEVASGYYIYLVTSPTGQKHGTFAIIR